MNFIVRTFQNSSSYIWNNLTHLTNSVQIFSETNKNLSNIIPKYSFLEQHSARIHQKQNLSIQRLPSVENPKVEWNMIVQKLPSIDNSKAERYGRVQELQSIDKFKAERYLSVQNKPIRIENYEQEEDLLVQKLPSIENSKPERYSRVQSPSIRISKADRDLSSQKLTSTKYSKPERDLSVTPIRCLHLDNRRAQVPKTPDLIYFPHLIRWVKTKLKFKYLKRVWDPTFSEGAFIYGSTHAVCRITEIINSNKISELDGLLTTPAKMKLVEDMTRKLSKTQREIIRISPRDIKILVPMSVNLEKTEKTKRCKISMRVLALKWFPQNTGYLRLVLVALQSEFMKDYTHGIDQDWNISGFDVMECTVLTEAPSRGL